MIRRKDLVDIADADYTERKGEFIICQDCEFESGGTRGDLFMLPLDKVLTCPECKSENLALVNAHREITIVKK